jgi:tetratricopeptide (TPR) repeat protein
MAKPVILVIPNVVIACTVLFIVSAFATFIIFSKQSNGESLLQQPQQRATTSAPTLKPKSTPFPIPEAKTLTGGTQVFQTFNNCGPASLSMALSYYGTVISQKQLGQELRPYQHPRGDNDDKSVTLVELAKKAEDLGFMTYYRPAGDIELLQQFVAQDIPVVTRTWLKQGEDIGHFRVVKGYDKNRGVVIQDDSLQGKDLSYSYADFLELWKAFNYEFLVLVPAEKKQVAEQIMGERTELVSAWSTALELAHKELSKEPDNIYAEFNTSVALYHLGRYQESLTSFEKVESKLPFRMLWYQVEPLMAYYKAGNYDKVMTMSDAILARQNRAYSELYYLRGLVYQKQSQQQQAQETFSLAEQYNSTEYWRYNVVE